MRKAGTLLLLAGFAWLALQQFDILMRDGIRSVGLAQHAKLSANPAHRYTDQDVRNHIRETALASYAQFPLVIAPGLMMLAGGLLIFFGGRQRKP